MSVEAVRYQVSFPFRSNSTSSVGAQRLDGDLLIPAGIGPHPAVVLVGSTSGQRDRGHWVETLAVYGVATLTWDSPGWGTSPGPRRWQAPDERAHEVVAAAEFLSTVRDVAPGGIALVGSDAGAWAAALGATHSSHAAALVMLAPPCTGAAEQEFHRLGQRLSGRGFITAEVALAQMILRMRIGRLAAGDDGATLVEAEGPCRTTPWYPELPGTTAAEIDAFGTLVDYDPEAMLSWVGCPILGVFGADDPATPARANAEILREALGSDPDLDHHVLVLPRTDDAFDVEGTPSWSAPRVPGDWRHELVGAMSDWLAPRLRRNRPLPTPVMVPRAG